MARIRLLSAFVLASGLVVAGACKKSDDKGKTGDTSGKTTEGDKKTPEKGGDSKSGVAPTGGAADDLSLLPVDSEAVMGLNFSQLQQSALWKKFVEPQMMKGDFPQKMAQFKDKCGFDP